MKKLTFFFFLIVSGYATSQNDSNLTANKIYASHLEEVEITDPSFERHFNFMKRKVVKMYPYAQYCKELLYEFNKELISTTSKRKRRKLGKETNKELKENFKYVVLNMTETEGRVLTKLIHKETGMSVYDIIETYRGTANAKYWNLFSRAFDQDLESVYDPDEDWIIETIYNRIKAGVYNVDDEAEIISKDDHKEHQKELKEKRKKRKKKAKEIKKEKRQKEREARREARREKRNGTGD